MRGAKRVWMVRMSPGIRVTPGHSSSHSLRGVKWFLSSKNQETEKLHFSIKTDKLCKRLS